MSFFPSVPAQQRPAATQRPGAIAFVRMPEVLATTLTGEPTARALPPLQTKPVDAAVRARAATYATASATTTAAAEDMAVPDCGGEAACDTLAVTEAGDARVRTLLTYPANQDVVRKDATAPHVAEGAEGLVPPTSVRARNPDPRARDGAGSALHQDVKRYYAPLQGEQAHGDVPTLAELRLGQPAVALTNDNFFGLYVSVEHAEQLFHAHLCGDAAEKARIARLLREEASEEGLGTVPEAAFAMRTRGDSDDDDNSDDDDDEEDKENHGDGGGNGFMASPASAAVKLLFLATHVFGATATAGHVTPLVMRVTRPRPVDPAVPYLVQAFDDGANTLGYIFGAVLHSALADGRFVLSGGGAEFFYSMTPGVPLSPAEEADLDEMLAAMEANAGEDDEDDDEDDDELHGGGGSGGSSSAALPRKRRKRSVPDKAALIKKIAHGREMLHGRTEMAAVMETLVTTLGSVQSTEGSTPVDGATAGSSANAVRARTGAGRMNRGTVLMQVLDGKLEQFLGRERSMQWALTTDPRRDLDVKDRVHVYFAEHCGRTSAARQVADYYSMFNLGAALQHALGPDMATLVLETLRYLPLAKGDGVVTSVAGDVFLLGETNYFSLVNMVPPVNACGMPIDYARATLQRALRRPDEGGDRVLRRALTRRERAVLRDNSAVLIAAAAPTSVHVTPAALAAAGVTPAALKRLRLALPLAHTTALMRDVDFGSAQLMHFVRLFPPESDDIVVLESRIAKAAAMGRTLPYYLRSAEVSDMRRLLQLMGKVLDVSNGFTLQRGSVQSSVVLVQQLARQFVDRARGATARLAADGDVLQAQDAAAERAYTRATRDHGAGHVGLQELMERFALQAFSQLTRGESALTGVIPAITHAFAQPMLAQHAADLETHAIAVGPPASGKGCMGQILDTLFPIVALEPTATALLEMLTLNPFSLAYNTEAPSDVLIEFGGGGLFVDKQNAHKESSQACVYYQKLMSGEVSARVRSHQFDDSATSGRVANSFGGGVLKGRRTVRPCVNIQWSQNVGNAWLSGAIWSRVMTVSAHSDTAMYNWARVLESANAPSEGASHAAAAGRLVMMLVNTLHLGRQWGALRSVYSNRNFNGREGASQELCKRAVLLAFKRGETVIGNMHRETTRAMTLAQNRTVTLAAWVAVRACLETPRGRALLRAAHDGARAGDATPSHKLVVVLLGFVQRMLERSREDGGLASLYQSAVWGSGFLSSLDWMLADLYGEPLLYLAAAVRTRASSETSFPGIVLAPEDAASNHWVALLTPSGVRNLESDAVALVHKRMENEALVNLARMSDVSSPEKRAHTAKLAHVVSKKEEIPRSAVVPFATLRQYFPTAQRLLAEALVRTPWVAAVDAALTYDRLVSNVQRARARSERKARSEVPVTGEDRDALTRLNAYAACKTAGPLQPVFALAAMPLGTLLAALDARSAANDVRVLLPAPVDGAVGGLYYAETAVPLHALRARRNTVYSGSDESVVLVDLTSASAALDALVDGGVLRDRRIVRLQRDVCLLDLLKSDNAAARARGEAMLRALPRALFERAYQMKAAGSVARLSRVLARHWGVDARAYDEAGAQPAEQGAFFSANVAAVRAFIAACEDRWGTASGAIEQNDGSHLYATLLGMPLDVAFLDDAVDSLKDATAAHAPLEALPALWHPILLYKDEALASALASLVNKRFVAVTVDGGNSYVQWTSAEIAAYRKDRANTVAQLAAKARADGLSGEVKVYEGCRVFNLGRLLARVYTRDAFPEPEKQLEMAVASYSDYNISEYGSPLPPDKFRMVFLSARKAPQLVLSVAAVHQLYADLCGPLHTLANDTACRTFFPRATIAECTQRRDPMNGVYPCTVVVAATRGSAVQEANDLCAARALLNGAFSKLQREEFNKWFHSLDQNYARAQAANTTASGSGGNASGGSGDGGSGSVPLLVKRPTCPSRAAARAYGRLFATDAAAKHWRYRPPPEHAPVLDAATATATTAPASDAAANAGLAGGEEDAQETSVLARSSTPAMLDDDDDDDDDDEEEEDDARQRRLSLELFQDYDAGTRSGFGALTGRRSTTTTTPDEDDLPPDVLAAMDAAEDAVARDAFE